MPRTAKKPTATIDPNLVNISDFCLSEGINEQIFRLELMQFVDNADSLKYITPDVASSVAISLTTTQPALLPTQEIPETIAPQSFEPSQETATEVPQKPQNNAIVGNTPNSLNKPPAGANVPTLLDELLEESEEVIELADLVHSYRNAQIIQNAQTRDLELVATLRERRIDNRNKIFDQLRDLNARQPVTPDLPELPSSLKDEIKALSNELGKQLSA
jgi:hypothetical protein